METDNKHPWRKLPKPWIADIGSGGDPYPLANILVDKFIEPNANRHRQTEFRAEGKLVVVADVANLPFGDGELDFVRCSHVLEHCARPDLALRELQRVSRKGEAWVPTIFSECVSHRFFPGKSSGHRWLCSKDFQRGWMFLQYDDTNHEEVEAIFRTMGIWDSTPTLMGWGTEMRMAWGWGGWPDVIKLELMVPERPWIELSKVKEKAEAAK